VRIESAKWVSAPLAEAQEIASASNRGVPRNLASHKEANGALLPLQLGQELEALIVEELDGGRLLLKVGATLIETDSPGGLAAGQSIRLRVEQLQPQIVLHVTDVESTIDAEAVRLLRSRLPAHADLGELLDSLHYRLADLLDTPSDATYSAEKLAKLRESIAQLLARGTPLTAEKLKLLARDGGLFYEAKLLDAAATGGERLPEIAGHDLKGLLLSALQESYPRAFSTGLENALNLQLHNLETQQAVNLLAQLTGGAIQMQIPFFTGARFTTAALAVEPDAQGPEGEPGKQKRGYSLLFMLDLENFGRMRIDAHVDLAEFRGVFFVDNERSLQLIRQELHHFFETLMALGYGGILLAAKPLKDLPIDKQEQFASLAAGAPSAIHLLDLKA
jgi:hypothetical protein